MGQGLSLQMFLSNTLQVSIHVGLTMGNTHDNVGKRLYRMPGGFFVKKLAIMMMPVGHCMRLISLLDATLDEEIPNVNVAGLLPG